MNIASIINKFFKNIEILDYKVFGNGHINDTYLVDIVYKSNGIKDSFILQRINHIVFKDPLIIMKNIRIISDHIRTKLEKNNEIDIDRKSLSIIQTIDNQDVYIDENNNYWRVFLYIKDSKTIEFTNSKEKLFAIASTYGKFLTQLSDLEPNSVTQTIPNFHNIKIRFEEFKLASRQNKYNRKANISDEIKFLKLNKYEFNDLDEKILNDFFPIRVTHNDTKTNNVLLDSQTGKGLCVVDLDTIMPGYSIFDFGDLVRSSLRNAPESEKDLSKIYVDLEIFTAITKGFLSETKNILTQNEIDNLVNGSIVITMMIGMRFLTDYLNGDKYFKTSYNEQNLDRCRVQFKLVNSMQKNKDKMEEIVHYLFLQKPPVSITSTV